MAKLHSLWKQKYPHTCGYIEGSLPIVISDSPSVWAEFKKTSGLDEGRARAAVQISESGPSIWFRDLGAALNAYFRYTVPERIELNTLVAQEFEKTPSDPKAHKFLEQIILHEMIHWAHHPNHPPFEAGEKFEIAAYGSHLPRFWDATVKDAATPFTAEDVAGSGVPRGIRNNNPGNIKRSSSQWMGLADASQMTKEQLREETFCVFTEPRWGLRAMAYLLLKYQRDYNCKSTWEIIQRWAPQSDNNHTLNYATYVASRANVGLHAAAKLTDPKIGIPFMAAMIAMENSKQPYSNGQIGQAFIDAAEAIPAAA